MEFHRQYLGCIEPSMTVRQLVGEKEEHAWHELADHMGKIESEGEDSEGGDTNL